MNARRRPACTLRHPRQHPTPPPYPHARQAGYHTRSQEEIHELLLAFAEAGATVVRLKGGDPYVFGRCAALPGGHGFALPWGLIVRT